MTVDANGVIAESSTTCKSETAALCENDWQKLVDINDEKQVWIYILTKMITDITSLGQMQQMLKDQADGLVKSIHHHIAWYLLGHLHEASALLNELCIEFPTDSLDPGNGGPEVRCLTEVITNLCEFRRVMSIDKIQISISYSRNTVFHYASEKCDFTHTVGRLQGFLKKSGSTYRFSEEDPIHSLSNTMRWAEIGHIMTEHTGMEAAQIAGLVTLLLDEINKANKPLFEYWMSRFKELPFDAIYEDRTSLLFAEKNGPAFSYLPMQKVQKLVKACLQEGIGDDPPTILTSLVDDLVEAYASMLADPKGASSDLHMKTLLPKLLGFNDRELVDELLELSLKFIPVHEAASQSLVLVRIAARQKDIMLSPLAFILVADFIYCRNGLTPFLLEVEDESWLEHVLDLTSVFAVDLLPSILKKISTRSWNRAQTLLDGPYRYTLDDILQTALKTGLLKT